jgi:hypothetical protein
MTWFLIESGVALLVLVFIVWWTVPSGKRRKDSADSGVPNQSDPD